MHIKLVIAIISYSFMAEESHIMLAIIKCIFSDINLYTHITIPYAHDLFSIFSIQCKLYMFKFSHMLRLMDISYFC
jgi:hypothetical protein